MTDVPKPEEDGEEENCPLDLINLSDEEDSSEDAEVVPEDVSEKLLNLELKVTEQFFDYYCKSKKARKRFKTLLGKTFQSIQVSFHFDELILRISGNETFVKKSKMIIEKAANKLLRTQKQFTHLITLPFIQQEFVKSFLEFKQNLLDESDLYGIKDESLFQNYKKLHMTIACLSLENDSKIKAAREIFKNECLKFQKNFKDKLDKDIQIKGLATMNEDLKKTNVLYAKVENLDNLQILADSLVESMAFEGLLLNDEESRRKVKFHLTLMNTTYLKRNKIRKRRKGEDYEPSKKIMKHFDATKIIEDFGEHHFAGPLNLPPMELNELHNINQDGYYQQLESFDLV